MSLSILIGAVLMIMQLQGVRSEQLSTQPCHFCTRGEITSPDQPISIPGYEFIDSCGAIDSIVPVVMMEGSPECDLVQSISSLCGCPKPQDSCSYCPDGSSVPDDFKDKQVTWLSDQFDGLAPTCEMIEAYVASLSETNKICTVLQLSSAYCGCPPRPNHCNFCNGEPLKEEFYNKELSFLRGVDKAGGTDAIGFTPTCEMYYATQYQLENTNVHATACYGSAYIVTQCGCNDGIPFYHGTNDEVKHAVLGWLPRAIGVLSLCAAILVISDILRDPKKRAASVYHQLVCTAAVFDMITSIVWIVGPAAINSMDPSGTIELGIYGTTGTNTTCEVQGFFFQLGLTSVFVNVSLTAYFMLVVVFGFRERLLKKKKMWLFGVPIVLGSALSFAVIPFIFPSATHCQFNLTILWVNIVFGLLPILGSSFSILVMLMVIYWKVRKQARRQRRWHFKAANGSSTFSRESTQSSSSSSSSSSEYQQSNQQRPSTKKAARKSQLERVVFRQCLSYAAAFGITWPILAVALVKFTDGDLPYGFWVFVTATAAMQGFNNSLCYFQVSSRGVFGGCCRKKNVQGCCRGMARGRQRLVSRLSLDRLHRSSVKRESVDETTTTVRPHLDPADELANWGDEEEDEVLGNPVSATPASEMVTENVTAESHPQGEKISKNDVVLGSGGANQQGGALSQDGCNESAIDDMAPPEGAPPSCVEIAGDEP